MNYLKYLFIQNITQNNFDDCNEVVRFGGLIKFVKYTYFNLILLRIDFSRNFFRNKLFDF